MGILKKTLGRKLATAALLPLTLGVGLVAATSSWREMHQYLDGKQREAVAIATVLSSSVADALVNDDRPKAIQSLRSIGRIPDVRYVGIRDASGRQWVTLGDGIMLEAESAAEARIQSFLLGNPVEITAPIIKAGEPIGTIAMIVETEQARDHILTALAQSFAIVLLAGAAALFIVIRLQAGVLRPMRRLMDTMQLVRSEQRFDLSVARETEDETGELVDAFNAMLVNIRERDASLADHRATLEQKVEDRTLQLKKAKEAAEAATRAKSEFLATMSHEIRTPMNGMMVMSEILATAELPPRYRNYAELVFKSGNNLLAIINDILDFSKIEAGSLRLESVETAPRQIVEDVLQLFWQQARSKNLDLAATIEPAVPETILGDPVRLTQIVSNLVNNALKFTENGHVLVSLGYEPHKTGDGVVVLSVTDTGIGISSEGLSRIFDSFTQADQSTTRKYGGTGLGLTICRTLVEAMGGTISASSKEGEGTRFDVRLPVTALAAPSEIAKAPDGSRALVIGKPAPSLQILCDALAHCGFAVSRAASANEFTGAIGRFHTVFSRAEDLQKALGKVDTRFGVVLSEIGDFSAEALFASGRAHEMLMHPVTSAACERVIDGLLAGRPSRMSAFGAQSMPGRGEMKFPDAKVLVADDSAVNREVIALALRQLGIKPDIVENGMQAIGKIRSAAYDLVLMDASMPQVDGFAATRMIRSFEKESGRQPVPVIALTAHTLGQIAEKVEESGMDGHLLKPFTLQSLGKVVAQWCGRSAGKSAGEAPASVELRAARGGAIIDLDALDNLREIAGPNADAMLRKLYGLFESNAPGAMLTLHRAAQQGTAPDIANAAHALKSMSTNMAAARLAGRLAELEDSARNGIPVDVHAMVEEISTELADALTELRKIMDAELSTLASKVPA